MRHQVSTVDNTGADIGTETVGGKPVLQISVVKTVAATAGATTASDVIASDDMVKTFTWSDFGTSNQRVSTIVYTSASLAKTVTDTFAYTLTGGAYRLDTITRVLS